jgi:hypothetical protein
MKKILVFAMMLCTGFLSCDKEAPADLPACIRHWIDVVEEESRWNPPAEVNEYQYNGKTVYLLSANCCDQYNTLIDNECNYICAPSGGIGGGGDLKCTDFEAKAKFVRLVWKDPR